MNKLAQYLETRLIELDVRTYMKIFYYTEQDERLKTEKVMKQLAKSADFYIQNNIKWYQTVQKILDELESRKLMEMNMLNEKRSMYQISRGSLTSF